MLSRVGRAVVEEVVGGAAGVCEQIRSGQLRVVAQRVEGDGVVCSGVRGVEDGGQQVVGFRHGSWGRPKVF